MRENWDQGDDMGIVNFLLKFAVFSFYSNLMCCRGRNRSRTRRDQPAEESSDQKKTESDSENEKLVQQGRSNKHRTPDPSDRRMSGHRRRRSHSRTYAFSTSLTSAVFI